MLVEIVGLDLHGVRLGADLVPNACLGVLFDSLCLGLVYLVVKSVR